MKLDELWAVLEKAGFSGYGLLVALVVLALVARCRPSWVYEQWRAERRARAEQAKALLATGLVSPGLASALKEQLEADVFLRQFGIQAEPGMRSSLIRLKARAGDEVSWLMLRRARPYLRMEGGHLTVSLGKGDVVGRWLLTLMASIAFLLAGLYALSAVVSSFAGSSRAGLGQTFLATSYVLAAVSFERGNVGYHAARRLQNWLRRPASCCAPSRQARCLVCARRQAARSVVCR